MSVAEEDIVRAKALFEHKLCWLCKQMWISHEQYDRILQEFNEAFQPLLNEPKPLTKEDLEG